MLHLFMNSPVLCDFQALLQAIGDGDELLLLSDGVVAGLSNSVVCKKLMFLDVVIYALKDDLLARGLFDYISKKIYIIDYVGFVTLTEKHNLCISW